MENTVANQEQNPSKNNKPNSPLGVPYPTETIDNIISVAQQLVQEHGTGKPISKEAIAKAVGKSEKGLSQYYSTFVQYGVLSTVHGKGYAPTDLFRKFLHPVHEGDERKYKLEMFKKPSLYAKIIENQNGHVIPTDPRRFGNMLKGAPFYVTDYATEKAARIFIENARNLGLLDGQNTLRVNNNEYDNIPPVQNGQGEKPKDPIPSSNRGDADLFELPIPLSGNRKAKLLYPLDNLTRKDIRVIAKALAFIASTVLNEDDAEDAEKDIKNLVDE